MAVIIVFKNGSENFLNHAFALHVLKFSEIKIFGLDPD